MPIDAQGMIWLCGTCRPSSAMQGNQANLILSVCPSGDHTSTARCALARKTEQVARDQEHDCTSQSMGGREMMESTCEAK